MSENKDNKNAPFNPLFYEEENFDYPSDRLTLRDLRLLWPEPQDLGEAISRVRAVEHYLAEGVAIDIDHAASGRTPRGPGAGHVPERQYLKEFYVATKLATGDHSAEMLIRDIEERAQRQYQPKTSTRPR